MILKVCGMRDPENIRQVASLKPDMLGFIFYDKSPRNARNYLQAEVLGELPDNISTVAVFVNPTIVEVADAIHAYGFDYVQLHGDESREFIMEVRLLEKGIIKAVPGNLKFNKEYMSAIEPLIDYWLIDTRTDKHGGTGISFDRRVLETFAFTKPVILSGGIDETELRTILGENHPVVAGVDVNSKMEDAPGLKNIDKVKSVKECLRDIM